MMHMSYWFGNHVNDLLIRGFTITSTAGLFVTCLGLVSVAIMFEGIKVYQAHMKHKTVVENKHCHSHKCSSETESLISIDKDVTAYQQRWLMVLRETGWYVIQIILSYMLMLCIMTYNGYFTIAITLGGGLGYLVFGPVLLQISMRNGCFVRPQRECHTCLETVRDRDNAPLADVGILPNLPEGMVHCAVPPQAVEEEPQCCSKSVAQVHKVDV